MRRHSRYGGGARRTKKIRSPISIKNKTAKRGGRCSGCRSRFEVGDEVTYVKVKRRVYHAHTCVPANAGQMPTAGGPTPTTAAEVAKSLSANWQVPEAQMVGLLALENALVVAIKRGQMRMNPEVEKSFDRYEKLKQVAMRPGSAQEGKQAMKMATIDLVKLVFGA